MKSLTLVLIAVLLAMLGGYALSSAPAAARPPDPDIVDKLRRIIQLQEQVVDMHGTLVQAGRARPDNAAEIALAEARIELAREQNNPEAIRAELARIVEARRGWVEYLEKLITDRYSQMDLHQARIDLIKAEVELLRAGAKRIE